MHPAGQGSDGAMDRALEAGLPPEHLAILMAARRRWWAEHAGQRATPDPVTGEAAAQLWGRDLTAVLEHPAAPAFDEVFVAAMRRDLGLR